MKTTTHIDEQAAIVADARMRLAELYAVRDVLLPDADDSVVLSELVTIESEIRSAEAVLAEDAA